VAAQGVTGTVKGQIVDAAGVGVPGITVALSDTSKGLTRTVTTNASGRFQLQLAPGIYVLKSSGSTYTAVTVEQVSVNVAAVTEMIIPVRDSVIEEVVSYGTPAPLLATATGETSLNISLEELRMVPVSRSIEAVALLAPGTVPGIKSWGGGGGHGAYAYDKTLVSLGGASVAENVYYIDGLNVTNFRNGMGGSSVPFEFYDQFQIKTGGYSPEFGRSTGGVLNATTRRGNNEFEYGIVTYYEPELGQGSSPDTVRADGSYYDFNSKNSESSLKTDLYVGGPVIKDHLFFFVLYEPQDSSSEYTWRESVDRFSKEKTEDDFWGGNLTWNITDNHSLSYTAFSDERGIVEDVFDFDVVNKTIGDKFGSSTYFRGGQNHILSYDAKLTDKFYISALIGKNESSATDRASTDIECPLVTDVSDSATSFRPGCEVNAYIFTGSDERKAYRVDLEYYIGNHTLRAGFDREDNVSFEAQGYSGLSLTPTLAAGAHYRYETWDVGSQLPNGAIMPDINGDGSRVDTVRFRYFEFGGSFDTLSSAWYVEDRWEINDAFTLSLGIRNETFENFNGVGELYFDIEDQWAPRLALSWTPGGLGEQRVNLSWGRYHLPIMALPNIALGSADLDYRRYFVFDGNRDSTTAAPVAIDADGIPTTLELGSVFFTADGTVPEARGSLDTSLKPMYQDEWIIAYERDFGDDWVAGIRYVNRELQSLIEDVLTWQGLAAIGFPGAIGWGQPCTYVMTNPGTDMTTFCDLDGDGTLEETVIPAEALGYPKAQRTYEAVELTVEKSFSDRWALQGSYTWSENKGNTEGSVKSDIGQEMANLTQDFDFPQLMDGAYGYLPNDRRHKLRLWASYQATDRLSLGANLFAQSGRPINKFGISHPDGTPPYGDTFYLQQPDGSFEFVPRGTSGRTDWITQLDLAAIYAFSWGDSAKVELRAEVFNLFDSDGASEVYEGYEWRPDQFELPMEYQQPRYLRFGAAIRF
jgi:hypothetical protein